METVDLDREAPNQQNGAGAPHIIAATFSAEPDDEAAGGGMDPFGDDAALVKVSAPLESEDVSLVDSLPSYIVIKEYAPEDDAEDEIKLRVGEVVRVFM
ncbi:hypothetical protein HK101_002190, partial [Irineochytrium annulatum]